MHQHYSQYQDDDQVYELVSLIQEASKDLNAAYFGIHHLIDSGIDLDRYDGQGRTALHVAVVKNYDVIVDQLLEAGANVNMKTVKEGDCPLHIAVRLGHLDCVRSLLRVPQLDLNVRNLDSNTPAYEAVIGATTGSMGETEAILDMLIDHHADLSLIGSDGTTPLHVMASRSMLGSIKTAIMNGYSFKAYDSYGNLPIHSAAAAGSRTAVSLLIEHEPDLVNETNSMNGLHPAQVAEQTGHLDIARDIHGASLLFSVQSGDSNLIESALSNSTEFYLDAAGSSAAHIAASSGQTEVLQTLVSSDKFDTNTICSMVNDNLDTPVHLAAKNGHTKSVSFLIRSTDKGYDVATSMLNEQGYAPIHLAAYYGHLAVLHEILLSEPIVLPDVEKSAAIASQDSHGNTPLHLASIRGHSHVVEFLIARGAVVDAENTKRRTPLHLATWHNQHQVAHILLDCRANPYARDHSGMTPLSIAEEKMYSHLKVMMTDSLMLRALEFGHVADVMAAASAGADLHNFQNLQGDKAAHIAVKQGHVEMLKFLHSYGISLEEENAIGFAPIHVACKAGQVEVAKILLDVVPGSVHSQSREGDTPLHIAAREGFEDLTELLISKGSDINLKNAKGAAPLHEAVCEHSVECVKMLLQVGADPNEREGLGGNTPLHLVALWQSPATSRGTIALLLKFGADSSIQNFDGYTPDELGKRNGIRLKIEEEQTPSIVHDDKSGNLIDLGEEEASISIASSPVQAPAKTQSGRLLEPRNVENEANEKNSSSVAVRATGDGAPVSPFLQAAGNMPPLTLGKSSFNDKMIQKKKEENANESMNTGATSAETSNSNRHQDLIIPFEQLEIDKTHHLGSGSYGVVYAGRLHGNKVAIKVLREGPENSSLLGSSDLESNTKRREAFLGELAIMARLWHDNIQEVRGYVEIPDMGPAIVSRFYARGSLASILKNALRSAERAKEMTWARRIKIATDIAKGMQCMHAKNPPIIHRDLKAANCFVDDHWNTYVGDFGFTKDARDHNPYSGCPTNPRWLAPETFADDSNAFTRASDVYSFGIILYELLTFRVPWSNLHSRQLTNMIAQGERPTIPNSRSMPGSKEDNDIFQSSGALHIYIDLMKACWDQCVHLRPDIQTAHAELRGLFQMYHHKKSNMTLDM